MADGPRAHRHVLSYRRTASRECWHTGAGNREAVGGSEIIMEVTEQSHDN